VHASITSPLTRPSPNGRRVGIRIVTFEACSGFTRVTARRIAQPPKATFVTRLQPSQLPSQAARQLPDQSTTLRVESSSTDDSRLRGALPIADIARCSKGWVTPAPPPPNNSVDGFALPARVAAPQYRLLVLPRRRLPTRGRWFCAEVEIRYGEFSFAIHGSIQTRV
jgi:hypothetical protein